jgi:MurNAc alpha-1-phosphate uridylyltransferase
MLFAAGFGTRMGALTQDRPKPLIAVNQRPLIDHALGLALEMAPHRVVANLHYRADLLDAHLGPKGVTTLIEAPDILDTGGGLKNALDLLGDDPVFTMNTDAIWTGPNPLQTLSAAWDPDAMDALMMCVPPDRALGHDGGTDFSRDGDGRLSRGPGLIYGGVQIIKTERLHAISDRVFSLNRVWNDMMEDGRLFGCVHTGQWCDVGHPQGIPLAEALLQGATDV